MLLPSSVRLELTSTSAHIFSLSTRLPNAKVASCFCIRLQPLRSTQVKLWTSMALGQEQRESTKVYNFPDSH